MSTDYGINREEALALMQTHISNSNLRKHCLASEAVLRALARHLGEDEELWGLCGLLHDLDAESHPDLREHTHHTVEVLQARGVHADIIEAIRLHNETAHTDKCTHCGLEVDAFLALALTAMQGIASELEL